MRVSFDAVFNVSEGRISPKGKVKIGGVIMTPGVSFGGGVSMGGVNLAEHIGKDLDVKEHADGTIEVKGIFQPTLEISKILSTNKRPFGKKIRIIYLAVEYISHLYRLKYDCATIDVDKMAGLYRKWKPAIINMANRLLKQLPDMDVTSALGCYQATKALRDTIGKEQRTDLSSILRFKNPETGQPEQENMEGFSSLALRKDEAFLATNLLLMV